MPNDLNRNNHLIDDNDKSSRKKLTSSGFTASVWTISGVVLAACGSLDNLFSDGGGGGARGNTVSVNASPVQQARIYFDMTGDGNVDADDILIQDEQYPHGFTTDSRGLAHGIPDELYGRPFMAILDGAFDADTNQKLDGEYRSVPGADGRHSIASPITDLIVQTANDPDEDLEDALMRILNEGGGSYTPEEIEEIADALLQPQSYLDASGAPVIQVVQGLAKYLADNKAKQEAGLGHDEEHDYTDLAEGAVAVVEAVEDATLSPNPVVILNEDMNADEPEVQVEFIVGEHDNYVGIINAISKNGAPVRFEIVGDAAGNYDGPYLINNRGVIHVNEDKRAEISTGITTLQVRVSAGYDHAPTYVDVEIDVKEAPQIQLFNDKDYGFGPVTPVGIVYENDRPQDRGIILDRASDGIGDTISGGVWISGTVLNPEWMFRGEFADYFEMVPTNDGTFALALKEGENGAPDATLDYEAISYGATIDLYGMGAEYYDAVINLQVAVKDATPGASGVLSEFIDLQIVVRDVDEAEFSGDFHAYVVEDERVENDHIYARGVVNIDKMPYDATFTINEGAGVTEANGIYTVALDYGTFTYNLESGEWVYAVENAHDDVQSMNAADSFSDIFSLEVTDRDGTITSRAVYLNVLGANEHIHLQGHGSPDSDGAARFNVVAEPHSYSTSRYEVYDLHLNLITPDPDGVNGGYTYTWYRHDPGRAPVVVQEDRTIYPYNGRPFFVPADDFYEISLYNNGRIETGSYFSVDVSYTDTAGNEHVINAAYLGDKTYVDTIVVGTDDFDGNLNLGNAVPAVESRGFRTSDHNFNYAFSTRKMYNDLFQEVRGDVEYELIDTGAHYERLFYLNADNELIFTGNARDASLLGDSVELQLEVRAPDDTTEILTHTIVVDVTGESIFGWATEAEYVYYRDEVRIFRRQVVDEIAPDSEGIEGVYNYQWEYIPAPADALAGRTVAPGTVGGSQNWYLMTTEQQDAVANRGAQLRVTITYTDGAGNQESVLLATPTLFFHLNDAQEVTVLEGAYGTSDVVARANTETRNPNANIRYELTENPDNLFTIDAQTSAISFASAMMGAEALDYEDSNQQKRYVLEVMATDTSLDAGNTATHRIFINLGNADEDDAVYAVRGVIGDGETLRAVLETPDLDGGMTDIRYQWLVDGVEIAGATGATYTIGTANLYADYQLRVSYNDAASQDGDDPRSTSATVKTLIFAERADDYAPLIAESREGALLTVQATYDGVADDVAYALIGADATLFQIDADSGTISLANGATLDYATATEHSLTVAATYTDAGRTFTKLVDITINVGELVNNNAPDLTAPTDTGRTRDDRPAPAEGTDTGIRLSVADVDIDEANKHEFSITGTEADKFEVREINGALAVFLKAEQSIDYDSLTADEQANGITLTITITDELDDGTEATDDVEVTITEYNSLSWEADAGPQRFWVDEGAKTAGAAVASAAVISAEAGDVSYAFADGELTSGIFSINADTGAITYTADTTLNDAVAHQYVLNAVASHATNGDTLAAEIIIDVQNEGIYLTGNGQTHGSAEFIIRRGVDFASPHHAYQLTVSPIQEDPDGVNGRYVYTWYRHDPGAANPVVVDEDEYVPPFDYTGPDVFLPAERYYVLNNREAEQIEEGSYFSVDVSYTDGAGNAHVVNTAYRGDKTYADTIVIGAHNLDGNLNLGVSVPAALGKRHRDNEVLYELVNTGAAYDHLFELNDAGELIFTGNTRDAALLGGGVELQLEVRVPDETDEVFTHKIVVDVTGTSTFELARSTIGGLEHFFEVTEITPDPDGVVATHSYFSDTRVEVYSYRWFFEEVGQAPIVLHEDGYSQQRTGRPYIPAGDDYATTEWHSEKLAEGGYFFVDITYTDGDGNVHDVRVTTRAEYTLEGTATPGATLEVHGLNTDYADIDDSIPIKYRWFEQDADGANRVYIGDDTSTTHVLADTNAAKVYGVVVEYTNTNGGTFTAAKGNAHEVIAKSVVFDAATYTDTSSHDAADEDFSGFDPTPYFGDASNDDIDYQFAPGSTTDNGNTLRIKAGSGNTIIEEVKDGTAFDLLQINTDTGDISYAGDTYLDATDFALTPRQSKTYTINVRGIYDADGDGVDADDPYADVPYVISVAGTPPPHALFDLALTIDQYNNARLELTELFADPDGIDGRYVYTWTEYEKGKDPYKFSYDIDEKIYYEGGTILKEHRKFQADHDVPLGPDDVTNLANGASYEVMVAYTDNAGNYHEVITSTTAGYAIEGYATPGATLRAYEISPDIYGTDSAVDITYRWFAQDPDGANREYIHVGTSDTYTLTTTTADKVYGVVVEYTDNNGVTYTVADGNAPEVLADSVVFDKDVYVEPVSGLHENNGYGFNFGETAPSIFTTEPYFGDVSNDNIHYEFAPGSSANNGYSISIKAGSNNAILQETKGSKTIDIVTIDSATGDITHASGGYFDAGRQIHNKPDEFITYNLNVRGIYDADGDGIDTDDPYADVTVQIKVYGKPRNSELDGEAQIPNRQSEAHDPYDPDETPPPLDPIIAEG